jgi:hypothetical protein
MGKNLTGLKNLRIYWGKVDPAKLAEFFGACKELEVLYLTSAETQKQPYEGMEKIESLKSLTIGDNHEQTDGGLEATLQSKKLEELSITSSNALTGSCFLQAQCSNLKILDLSECGKLVEANLIRILKI